MRNNKLIVLLIMLALLVGSTTCVFADRDMTVQTEVDTLTAEQRENLAAQGINATESIEENGFSETEKLANTAVFDYANDSMDDIMRETKGYYAFSCDSDNVLFGGISIATAVNSITNVIFGVAKAFIKFAAVITSWALRFEIFDTLDDFMTTGPFAEIFELGNNVFSNTGEGVNALVWLGVVFSLCAVVLMFARRQVAGAFGKILGTILIMVLISSYVYLPNMLMSGAQTLTQQIGSSILSDDSGDPGRAAAMKLWLMGVDMPWQELELGEIIAPIKDGGALNPANESVHNWMIIYPTDRTKETANDHFEKDAAETIANNMDDNVAVQAGRAGETILVLILDIILAVVFIILSIVAIGFQIGSIIMWVLGFFILILALFPTHGVGKIREWAGGVAMTYFGQIVIYVVILLVTEIMGAFYSIGSMVGTFAALLGLAAGLWIMKGQIGSLFAGTGGSLSNAGPGGIANMGRAAKTRMRGYRGDSTQRLVNNPIRQNREAKRMAQRDAKMQAYQQKMASRMEAQEQKREHRSHGTVAATGRYVKAQANNVADKVGTPIKETGKRITEPIRDANQSVGRKIDRASDKVEHRTEVRQVEREQKAVARSERQMAAQQAKAEAQEKRQMERQIWKHSKRSNSSPRGVKMH